MWSQWLHLWRSSSSSWCIWRLFTTSTCTSTCSTISFKPISFSISKSLSHSKQNSILDEFHWQHNQRFVTEPASHYVNGGYCTSSSSDHITICLGGHVSFGPRTTLLNPRNTKIQSTSEHKTNDFPTPKTTTSTNWQETILEILDMCIIYFRILNFAA